jgi:3',5'-cyclic AMP phosphodiesterase CpdA
MRNHGLDRAKGIVTSRRRFLAGAAAAASIGAGPIDPAGADRSAGFTRFVHLTDVHLCRSTAALDGFAVAMDSIRRLDPTPDFIVTGGDHIMDAFGTARSAAKDQWDLYSSQLARSGASAAAPVFPVLGNHDIWGWGEGKISSSESGYGKAMALDRLGMRSAYYSFERAGWHFICLDNVVRCGKIYTAALDARQIEWLRGDLAAAGTRVPICIVSHIPLLSACVFFDAATSHGGGGSGYHVHHSCMQNDVGALLEVLRPYNVRLALSGHIHLIDRVDYGGTSFLCNGSICGNWWGTRATGFDEGYGVIDVWPDGSFSQEYVRLRRGA